MSTAVHDAAARAGTPPREPMWSRLLRGVGWLLIAAGAVVGLFVVYLVWWTDLEAAAAQDDLRREFGSTVAIDAVASSPDLRDLADVPVESTPLEPADPADPADPASTDADDAVDDRQVDDQGRPLVVPTDPGDSYAMLWFQRGDEFVVTDGPLAMVEGVTLDHLRSGPGHYPQAEAPGMAGNAAFAGHRTTYGRPFHDIDQLEAGDEIHVLDNTGRHWVYDFLETEIVAPSDVWVIEDGAREGVTHLLTLTSCHPKFSAAQRIVAFAELRGAPVGDVADPEVGDPDGSGAGTELPGDGSTAAPAPDRDTPRRGEEA